MYESPITLVQKQMAVELAEQFDGMIFNAVHAVMPVVDKEELLRALHYDRDQYDKGFADGKKAAAEELVRCKDCAYMPEAKVNKKGFLICPASGMEITDDDFCSYGERRSDD